MSIMSLIRRDPDDSFSSLQKEMNDVFARFFARGDAKWPELPTLKFVPNVELTESDNAIQVKAEVPGLDRKDIKITLTGDVLTLSGEKREERKEEKKNYYRRECSYGAFERSFQLPADVVRDRIEANFNNGVLLISLPKTEQAKKPSKTIEIK
ncbi:MAG: Hsp20/alpha crystallin family protein [Deltaproteobacteria bacterium]|nr:Hsp20/alpha crystallin family protein [Deltaproteobacteria bacterium]